MAALAVKHDLVVLSDEIYADQMCAPPLPPWRRSRCRAALYAFCRGSLRRYTRWGTNDYTAGIMCASHTHASRVSCLCAP
jgi:hypothetical protein